MTKDSPLRLHWHALSGHSHRAQLFASLLGLQLDIIPVDLGKGRHKEAQFLNMNRFGQVPVLEHGDFKLADSNAILVYLAERFDEGKRFWPADAERRGQIQRWLSVAAGELAAGPALARFARVFAAKVDQHAAAAQRSHDLFKLLETELSARPFLVGDSETLADIALYTYTAHAPEGDVSLEPYPAVRAWLERIEALPGFVPMAKSAPKS